ncbi:MAG: VCBS domain-containing protein, partial [Gammaproteobacteria bacterium]|nr:VCBS domain-containing protein [Gammaproteobacteria bacterium]
QVVAVSDLVTTLPGYTPELAQHADDNVTVIDVPQTLFAAVMPSLQELRHLTHVRQVNNKAGDLVERAVIIANRLPQKKGGTVVHLVSIENRINTDDSFDVGTNTDDVVRLVSLKRWRFACETQDKTFKELATNLDRAHDGLLRLAEGTAVVENSYGRASGNIFDERELRVARFKSYDFNIKYGNWCWDSNGTYQYSLDTTDSRVQALAIDDVIFERLVLVIKNGTTEWHPALYIVIAQPSTSNFDEHYFVVNNPQGDLLTSYPASTVSSVTFGSDTLTDEYHHLETDYGSFYWSYDGGYHYYLDASKLDLAQLTTVLDETISYTVDDGQGNIIQTSLTIDITAFNSGGNILTDQDFLTNPVLVGDSLLDVRQESSSDTTAYSLQGSLTWQANGAYSYYFSGELPDPNPNVETTTDNFYFDVIDKEGTVTEHSLTMYVRHPDADTYQLSTIVRQASGNLLTDRTDGSTVSSMTFNLLAVTDDTIAVTSDYGSMNWSTSGEYSYVLDSITMVVDDVLVDSFSYDVNDDQSNITTHTVEIAIIHPSTGVYLVRTLTAEEGNVLHTMRQDSMVSQVAISIDGDVGTNHPDPSQTITFDKDDGDETSLRWEETGNYYVALDKTFNASKVVTADFSYTIDYGNEGMLSSTQQATLTLYPSTANTFLEQGLLPLPHCMRDHHKTYSWYRGPLATAQPSNGVASNLPVHNSDELMIYQPETGLFNVSYATAWELGRLIALQDKQFSRDLFCWKRQYAQHQQKQTHASTHPHLFHGFDVGDFPIPQSLQRWLDELNLLEHVPLAYLVPKESTLPTESIRFFWIDPQWIACLLDGAFSMGRVDARYLAHDTTNHAHFAQATYTNLSGVLLRSELVSGWPGLQIDGLDRQGRQLPLLKQTALSDNMTLCIFQGDIAQVDVHQQPELLHFGVDEDTINHVYERNLQTVKLRYPDSDLLALLTMRNIHNDAIHDRSLLFNHGTTAGDVTIVDNLEGFINVLSLNGVDGSVTLTPFATVGSNSNFTLMCRMKLSAQAGVATVFAINQDNTNKDERIILVVKYDNSNGTFDKLNVSIGSNDYAVNTVVTDDSWHFIALTYQYDAAGSSHALTVYVDDMSNAVLSTTTAAAVSLVADDIVTLGATLDQTGAKDFMNAECAQLSLYKKVLTSSELDNCAKYAMAPAVIDIAALASTLASTPDGAHSAEFALDMIEGVDKVSFHII